MVFNLDSKHAMVFQSFFSWNLGFCEKNQENEHGIETFGESLQSNFQWPCKFD